MSLGSFFLLHNILYNNDKNNVKSYYHMVSTHYLEWLGNPVSVSFQSDNITLVGFKIEARI